MACNCLTNSDCMGGGRCQNCQCFWSGGRRKLGYDNLPDVPYFPWSTENPNGNNYTDTTNGMVSYGKGEIIFDNINDFGVIELNFTGVYELSIFKPTNSLITFTKGKRKMMIINTNQNPSGININTFATYKGNLNINSAYSYNVGEFDKFEERNKCKKKIKITKSSDDETFNTSELHFNVLNHPLNLIGVTNQEYNISEISINIFADNSLSDYQEVASFDRSTSIDRSNSSCSSCEDDCDCKTYRISPNMPSSYQKASESSYTFGTNNNCGNCLFFSNSNKYCNLWKATAHKEYHCISWKSKNVDKNINEKRNKRTKTTRTTNRGSSY